MESHFFLTPEHTLGRTETYHAELPQGAVSFSSEQELLRLLQDWPLRQLVDLWNSLPQVWPVRRFEDRAIAVARLWRALDSKSSPPHKRPKSEKRQPRAAPLKLPREDTKAALIVALLQRVEGATVKEIMAATGWQPHSVRGFISGDLIKKRRFKVRSSQRDGQHAYRIREASGGRIS